MGLQKMIEIGTILKTKDQHPCKDNELRSEQKEFVVIDIFENEKKTLVCLVLDGDRKQSPTEVYLGKGRLVDLLFRDTLMVITVDEINEKFIICDKINEKALKEIIRIHELKNAIENLNSVL